MTSERQFYVGCKQIEAWPEERHGQPGYHVVYPGGYTSWSPAAAFEAAYVPMGADRDGSKKLLDFLLELARNGVNQ